MPRVTVGAVAALVIGAAVGSPAPAAAQEVRWRNDYAAARKEATASGRPLLLDFGNEACVWCRKLDATTFRDPAVVALLNDRFIPVKVDGDREAWLTKAVGVQAFPTLVLIAADGKVLGRHEGYADAAKMMALLRPAAAPSAPKPAETATAARSPASDLLAAARTDHDAGRYLACLSACDRLMSEYTGSAEVADAKRLSAGITGDPDKWRRVTGQLESDLTALHRNLDAALKK